MLSFLILTLDLFNFYKFPINEIAVVDAKKIQCSEKIPFTLHCYFHVPSV